jgi:hypothetical protein
VVVNARRRGLCAAAQKRGSPPSHDHLPLLARNLLITNVPGTVWTPATVCTAYALRWQVALVFGSWKSELHLATLPTKTEPPALCYLYGRLLLIVLTSALCPALRSALWARQRRELSVLTLVRSLQARADRWLPALFESPASLRAFLSHVCVCA